MRPCPQRVKATRPTSPHKGWNGAPARGGRRDTLRLAGD